MTSNGNTEERYKAGNAHDAHAAETFNVSRVPSGQSCPHHYPHPEDALGEPLTIRDVARLLGCSDWTVRHAYLPKGLPHLRSGPMGKLVFFRNQVVLWILQHQRKGGM